MLPADSLASPIDSEPCSEEDPTETARDIDSLEPALWGRPLVGEFDDAKASSPKKDQRLELFDGLGVGSPIPAAMSAVASRVGIELRRLGEDIGCVAVGS